MNSKSINKFIKLVKFNGEGLVPVVVQDDRDDAVLMVAYMNKKSLRITLQEASTCFWSRSRRVLWRKGEHSGNRQMVKNVFLDCDGDCMLIRVRQIGDAACHTGYRSCFYRMLSAGGAMRITGKRVFDPRKVY